MKGLVLKAALAAVFSMGLVACGDGGGGSPSKEQSGGQDGSGKIQIDTKSCVYEIKDGELADMSLVSTSNIETVSFNKRFNSNLLLAVGRTNIYESIDFINLTESRLYQSGPVNSTECQRDLFASLPTLPSDLQKKWNEASQTLDTKSVLMGLYMPKDNSAANTQLPSVQNEAALIVRTNTSRWTLVHEFMHHLFMLQAVAEGYNEGETRKFFKDSIERFESTEKASMAGKEKIEKQADNLTDLSAGFDSMMVHFTLEEMAIEKTMKEYARQDKLAYAPTSSNWYIHSSADQARGGYEEIKRLAQNKLDLANIYGGLETSVAKYEAVIKLADQRLAEIRTITLAYPNYGSMIDREIGQRMGVEAHEGCSHEADGERVLDMIRQL